MGGLGWERGGGSGGPEPKDPSLTLLRYYKFEIFSCIRFGSKIDVPPCWVFLLVFFDQHMIHIISYTYSLAIL